MKKRKAVTGRIINRRAKYDYELGDSLVVGLALTGAETKALRQGHGNLSGAYVTLKDEELWLLNAQIFGTGAVPIADDQQNRTRKLLAKSSEIKKLADSKETGNTIVPLEFLTGGRYIKLKIAPGRGKKRYDKRQVLKKRDAERETSRAIRSRQRRSERTL